MPLDNSADNESEIVIEHKTNLSWGRASIKKGKYGRFLEFSKNVAKRDQPSKYVNFQVDETHLADVYAMRDECDRFINLVKSN